MTTTAPGQNEAVEVEVRSSPRCDRHLPPPGHPDTPSRLHTVLAAVTEAAVPGCRVVRDAPLPAEGDTTGVLSWVHSTDYLERIRAVAATGGGRLDSDDCLASAGTWDAAAAAAGLALQAALDVVNGRLKRTFLAIRPPSHHAEAERARGYCFVNAVAVVAEVVTKAWGLPVLIIDIDAHHGNGTQRHFWERGDVGYVSVHEYPAFPGSGSAEEIGGGRGLGLTRNVPLAAGSGDDEVAAALAAAVAQAGRALRPAQIVVSAALARPRPHPRSGLRMPTSGFGRLTRIVVQAADQWAGGRVVSLLEGGYQLAALGESAAAHVAELARGHGGLVM